MTRCNSVGMASASTTRRTLSGIGRGGDFATADAVLDPKAADGFIRRGEGAAADDFRMGEAGGVEVEADLEALGPGDPVLEVLRAEGVAVHAPAAGLGVGGVEVETVGAGDEGDGLLEIGPQLIGRAGASGVVAGDGEAVAERGAGVFKTAHVIALPAVHADGDGGEFLDGGFDVDAVLGVALAGEAVGGFELFGGHGWGRGAAESIQYSVFSIQ